MCELEIIQADGFYLTNEEYLSLSPEDQKEYDSLCLEIISELDFLKSHYIEVKEDLLSKTHILDKQLLKSGKRLKHGEYIKNIYVVLAVISAFMFMFNALFPSFMCSMGMFK